MNAGRERKIRSALADCVDGVVERDAGWVQPPPQLFEALALPAEFAQSIRVCVPMLVTSGARLVLSTRVTLVDATYGETWSADVLRVLDRGDEPELDDAERRTAELVEAAAHRRRAEADAVPPLPGEPAASAVMNGAGAALRLVPADPSGHRSRFGGVPFLPAGTSWPRRDSGRPLHFLAQLDLREVPRSAATRALPSEGVLAFFYDGDASPPDSDFDGFRVLGAPHDAALVPMLPPADTRDDFVRPVAGLRFAPGAEDDDEPVHRLLGEPDPIQGDPREELAAEAGGEPWLLLLQIDSGEPLGFDFGDAGRIYFLVRPGDLERRFWERVRVVFDCY